MALAAADGAPLLRTLLKREESYAVHALLYLHEAPGAAARQVAAALQTPSAFTAKVLQRLVSTGLIEARQGRRGGFRLAQPLGELSLLDVVEAVSGPVMMDICETKLRCPTQLRKGHCGLNGAWLKLTLATREAWRAVRLSDLVGAIEGPPGGEGGAPDAN
jgi:Rrf2 family protein